MKIFYLSKDINDYSINKALKLLFPNNPLNVVTIKVMATRLLVKDRLLHCTIVKCILPGVSNTTNIMEDKLFLL